MESPNRLDFSAPFTDRTPRVMQAIKLLRSAGRRKAKRFLAEGENAVEAAIATGAATDLFLSEHASKRYGELERAARNLDIYVHPITDKAAKALSDTVTTSGIFAVCLPVLWSTPKVLRGTPQLISVPVETSEPGNAGALIRLSDALGADAVVFAGNTVDPQGPKVVRASAGSLFHVPVARESSPKDVIKMLKSKGLVILATAADGEFDLRDAGAMLSQPTAWLFGNEAHGLTAELLEQADYRIRIPIRGRAESLNLANAAAICLYESAQAQSATG